MWASISSQSSERTALVKPVIVPQTSVVNLPDYVFLQDQKIIYCVVNLNKYYVFITNNKFMNN